MANQSAGMANHSTSMSDQSENSRSAQQTNFFLNYATRDQLIGCLNVVSAMLQSNEPIPEDARRRTCEKIQKSTVSLTTLLPFKPTAFVDQSATFEERIAAQLTIELPFEEQSSLIKHLLANRNTLLFYDQTTDQDKRNLINENKRIVVRLMEVPREEPSERLGDGRSPEVETEDENIGESPSKRRSG